MIKKVDQIGDLIEVTFTEGDEDRVIRRNVQGYSALTKQEKDAAISDIIGSPTTVFTDQKRSILDRILRRNNG